VFSWKGLKVKQVVRNTCGKARTSQGRSPGVGESSQRLHLRRLLLPVLLLLIQGARGQFYNGSDQEYGKNRVQYKEFLWQYYRFDDLETYFYKGGRDVARYVAISAHRNKKDLERFFDHTLDDRIQFVVYNTLADFRQSNVGVTGSELYNIGGVTRIVGTKVFVYNEGEHMLLERQVRSGLAQLILDRLMYGGNWREVLKNSTLLNLPEWFNKGMVAYCSGPWDAHAQNRIRDAVMNDRFKHFNRLEGEEATLAGLAIWTYVADTYGPSVIPNILYMTRVSRNPDNGFNYVLGLGLKQLAAECLAHYRARYAEEERFRALSTLEELPVRTRRTRQYSEFKLSPDGRHAAWVSNELGQYKVWLYDRAEKKVKRLLKGEKRLNRIVDRSFPVLAWHPSGRALSWTTERKGELLLTTYSLDDRSFTRKPVLLLDKILSMAYSPDGRNMIFSGVREGRTDLYLYFPIGNRQEQLTDDPWDDLDPAFVDGGNAILFASDRPDDTLRNVKDVFWTNGRRDLFRYDLRSRGPLLARLTSTPDVDERAPTAYDSANYAFLSDLGGVRDRWLLRFDSTVSAVDTVVHYRYFTTEARATNLRRGMDEHNVVAPRGWLSQLLYNDGRYRFQVGSTAAAFTGDLAPQPAPGPGQQVSPAGTTITDDMSMVVKVDPVIQRDTSIAGIDVRNYRFADEPPLTAADRLAGRERPTQAAAGGALPLVPAGGAQDSAAMKLAFPEQRNYNVNFATDEVLTQLDNRFDGRFYQVLTEDLTMNPGLSGLTRMAISDLMEDHKIVGGFRLALDLNNNSYLLKYQNLKRRIDKEIMVQRQAQQGSVGFGLAKLHTHLASFRLTYPFSELASLRASLLYRHDRYVVQSTDLFTLGLGNQVEQMGGAKLEWVYDSSIPRGLNLYTGWKLKAFAEYYRTIEAPQQPMKVLGFDLRHSLRVHRDLIWVTRLAGSSSLGDRKVLFVLGGVDNWLFPKVDNSTPVDFAQNYRYQAMGVPLRGFFYNARNGNNFAVLNTELRVPIFKYLLDRPIRSDFFQNFQVAAFGDLGSAWTGSDPYAEDNSFNTQVVSRPPLTIRIRSQREPLIGSYGFGLRTRLLGYFVRADWAWGIDDGVILDNVFHFSLALDI